MALLEQSERTQDKRSAGEVVTIRRELTLVAVAAVAFRLVFMALTANTYDYDEFVWLQLGRDFVHGAVPYVDFRSFHPPGILVVLAGVQPLTQLWWPFARLLMTLIDSASAVLVFKIGLLLWGRREALAAGLVYALNPLALVSAGRVGQDPLITFLGLLGLYSLLAKRSKKSVVVAGILLGVAIWIKYPAAYFVPVYVLAAPKRAPITVSVAALTFAGLMAPFHAEMAQIYQQTIEFQRTRWSMDFNTRSQTTLLFWLAVNALALPAFARRGTPFWLRAGFALGGLFLFSSQVYYHYFVPVVPFGALLAGCVLARLNSRALRSLLAAGAIVALGWGVVLGHAGASPLYVTAAHLSDIAPTVHLLDRSTRAGDSVLADRFEYAYLANRPAVDAYFWNVGVLVNARFVEQRVPHPGAVVMSYGASSGFPAGFTGFLDARFFRIESGANTVWLIPK